MTGKFDLEAAKQMLVEMTLMDKVIRALLDSKVPHKVAIQALACSLVVLEAGGACPSADLALEDARKRVNAMADYAYSDGAQPSADVLPIVTGIRAMMKRPS